MEWCDELAPVMTATLEALTVVASGQKAGLVSAGAALAEGVMKAMLMNRIKTALVACLIVGSLLLGSIVGHRALSAGKARGDSPEKEKPAADNKPPETLRDRTLAKEGPRAIYSSDANDPWNRIFFCLFTRSIRVRLSEDSSLAKRLEVGDRAIEPLWPSPSGGWTTPHDGAYRLMTEPIYSLFEKALKDALAEKKPHSPLARALMQADVWAAHDILERNYDFEGDEGKQRLARRNKLLDLIGRFVKKLALSPKQIKSLPDNYARAVAVQNLPDLFSADSGWWEVRYSEERIHDSAADFRRVARVFIKPARLPKDRSKFLNSLRQARNTAEQLQAVALLTQNLLLDSDGKVVASPLTYEVQVRKFVKDKDTESMRSEPKQFELSRRRLLLEPKSGGLGDAGDQSFYAPSAGNDYSFASHRHRGDGKPLLIGLKTRCSSCHGPAGVMTFNRHESTPLPPVRLLNPDDNEHARFVRRRKVERKDFKALQARWKQGKPRPLGRPM